MTDTEPTNDEKIIVKTRSDGIQAVIWTNNHTWWSGQLETIEGTRIARIPMVTQSSFKAALKVRVALMICKRRN